MTPNISGIVFFIPWLKPECEATILFGPGEQLVTNINKESDKISGCIIMLLVNRFQTFEMDLLILLFSEFMAQNGENIGFLLTKAVNQVL